MEAAVDGGPSNSGLCGQWLLSTDAAVGWRDNDTMALAIMVSLVDGGGGYGSHRHQSCCVSLMN